MPIVNGINLDEYDFGDSATSDSLSSSPKQTVNGINLSEYDFGEEKQKTIAPSPEETPEASFLRRVPDLGVSLLKGAVGLPEAVVGLLDIPTMGYAGKVAEGAGIRFKETQDILDSLYSPQQQAVNKEVADTKGFFPTIGKAFENPSFILQTVAESAPSMLGAGGIGRGLIKFFPKLAPVIAGAAGEGLVSGGQLAEQVRQGEESGLLSAGQAGIAGLSGMLTGVLGVVGGKLAKRLGVVDIDTLIAGGSVRAAVDDATAVAKKNVLRKMIESAISEGAFEELPQSLQEQMAQNVATGKPATEGVAEAGALGMLAGGAMGAFGGAGGHVLSGMEILQKDKENQDRSQEIQTFVANKGYTDLNNNDLLQAYAESDAVQKDLPDDAGLSGSMATMKSELEKRGIWPEDKLSVDIETKMAELDEKLGGTVAESSDLVRKTEGGDLDAERQVTEPTIPQGEDIITEPPMADTSKEIASSPSSFFGMPEIGTQEIKEEKTPSTLPLTELSEEGMANPPSTPEKTSQEATGGSIVAKKGSEFGLKGLNKNRWTVDGNAMGNTPEEAIAEYNKQRVIAKDEADQKATYDTILPKLKSGEYTEADIKKITVYGKTTTSTKQMDGILMSLGLTHKQAGQVRKKAGDVDTTRGGAILYDVGRTVETARTMGLVGEKKAVTEKKTPPTVKESLTVQKEQAPSKRAKAFLDKIKASKEPIARIRIPKLTAEEQQWLIQQGATFDVDRMGKPLLGYSQVAKANDLRAKVTGKAKLKPQSELTLESYARKHKINFNIPGHTNKEAISDGLLSYTKNDAIGLDKAAEEMQGLGLLGATPDGYATAGDYLYAELQKIVYNRINKKTQSLTAEEDQAIKEFKEEALNEGYDESVIEGEVGEDQRTGKKKAYSIKDSEAHGEAQSFLEEDDEFVKEEDETPTTELFDTSKMFTLSGNQPVEQKTMKVPEKKGERLLDVPKQTTDELKDRLSGEKAKREFEEGKKTRKPISKIEAKHGITGKEAISRGYVIVEKHFDKTGKTDHEIIDGYYASNGSDYNIRPTLTEAVDDYFANKENLPTVKPSHEMTFNEYLDDLKANAGKYADDIDIQEAQRNYRKAIIKAQSEGHSVSEEGLVHTDTSLKVTPLPKNSPLSPKDSQALVADILSILADGSSINFVGKIDPNRPDIQKALTQWKQGNPGASFVIEGMHRKVIVDGNTMASIIEVSMGSSDIKLTAWHEAWHSIDELFLTENEKKILAEKLTPDIERQADIFAKYAANQKHLLPKSAKPIFERIREFFEKVGNYLKGRGFTNAEDVFNRALRGELKERAQRWAGEGQTAFQISVKHGSPFVFDRFTTDRVGSGEGAQMFGWGLYFTDKEDIAKYYAEKLSRTKGNEPFWMVGNKRINESETDFDTVLNNFANGMTKEEVIRRWRERVASLEKLLRSSDILDNPFGEDTALKEAIEGGKRAIKYAESINEPVTFGEEEPKKNLYNVTLHKGKDPSEYHYMDWEKSVGKELATVIENAVGKEYLEKKYFAYNDNIKDFNGATAYNFLEDYLAEGNELPDVAVENYNYPKAVSLFLLRNGIDGIKYPAGTLSTGKTDAFNYVVFDENAVTIEDRVSFKMGNGKFNAAFREWFGNSKVVDENGEPLVVYHGTASDFESFRPWSHFGTEQQANVIAEEWGPGGNVIPAYLNIRNPLRMHDTGFTRADIMATVNPPNIFSKAELEQLHGGTLQDWEDAIKEKGYDGIVYSNTTAEGPGDSYVAFSPTQIKSVYNQGTWDANDPRISFKITPVIKNLIGRNAKKVADPEKFPLPIDKEFRRLYNEAMGKDYSKAQAYLFTPSYKAYGPNARPEQTANYENFKGAREERQTLNSEFMRRIDSFLNAKADKVVNVEKVFFEGDATLGQKIRDLNHEARQVRLGGNLELSKQLRERAKAIKILNRYSDEELANGVVIERTGEVVKLNPEEIAMYKELRDGYDYFLRYLLENMAKVAFDKYSKAPWFTSMVDLFNDVTLRQTPEQRKTLRALNKLALNKIRGKKAETIQKNRAALMDIVKEHIATVSGITDQAELSTMTKEMVGAYKKERVSINAIKKARNRIGQITAYAPRVREQGKAYFNIYKTVKSMNKDGTEKITKELVANYVIEEKAIYKLKPDLRAQAIREMWEDYKSRHKNEDLSYKIDEVTRESDTSYRGVNDMNLQRIIDNAITSIKGTKNFVDGPILDGLKNSLVQAVANEMKVRGFGRSLVSRKLQHIEGYKTTGLQKITVDYITGLTGMITKQKSALRAYDILKTIPKKDTVLYEDIAKYTQDMLRNQNGMDRASGKAKGLLFTWYLSGLLKMVPIQLTQNYLTGMPEQAQKMREWGIKGFAEARYHKAMADATTIRVDKKTGQVKQNSRINEFEARLLTESLHNGNTADQYVRYITGLLDTQMSRKATWLLEKLSRPFSMMETFNRESAALSMFRMAWEHYSKTIPDLEERYQAAKHEASVFVSGTHFDFGKENLPRLATGGDAMSIGVKTLMTFRSFNHNYVQFIFGSKDWKTIAHSLAYVAIFGGMMGLPFIKDILDLLEKLTGKSYTKSAREIMRKFGGKTLETFGIQGLPALAGANISGSLAMGIPFADWMTGGSASSTVFGVVGGMGEKIAKGINYGLKGELYRAGESLAPEMLASPMKAMRTSEIGKEYLGTTGYDTTSKGKPKFDENGKPLSMDTGDVIAKMMGFNPSGYSMKNEAQRSASNIEEYFSDWKTSIYETYRAGRTNHDPKTIAKALRQIREFNQAIVDKEVVGLIPRIKMSNVVKAAKMEMTKKQKREAQYKRNYLAS